jgi:hypothetical protein
MASISNIFGFAFLASEDTSLFETSFIPSISGHLYRNQDEFSGATILGDGASRACNRSCQAYSEAYTNGGAEENECRIKDFKF